MSQGERARRGVFRASAALVGVASAFACPARAAELPSAELALQRAAGAEGCPSEEDLAAQVRARLGATRSGLEPLWIEVVVAPDATGFAANVHVRGRKSGERALRADGPSCDGLRDALVVSLLLVLDDVPERAATPPVAARPATQPARRPAPQRSVSAPVEARDFARSPSARTATPVSLWVSGGAALTHGLPTGLSPALLGDVGLRWERGELWLGGFWAPERAQTFEPGAIELSVAGARLRGCYRVPGLDARARFNACAWGLGAALRGAARGFTTGAPRVRPWWLVGLGPDFHWFFSPGLALGVSAAALFTPHRERFTIANLGEAYTTDSVVGWVGVDANFRIW